jgi:molybdate/tungstate transport system substrate-binding protein
MHETTLHILHAGSLSRVMEELRHRLAERFPHLSLLGRGGGSVALAEEILRGSPCDLYLTADYRNIEDLLRGSGKLIRAVRFACNEKVLSFSGASRFAEQVNEANWFELLADPEVCLASTPPDADPGGYRTLMVLQLAELHYGRPGLAARILDNPRRLVLPAETPTHEINAMARSGVIDYMIRYRSSSVDLGFRTVPLPGEINLGDPRHAPFYKKASVELHTLGGTITVRGEPIVYGAAIPESAKHPEAAEAFLELLLSPEGTAILERRGFIPFTAQIGTAS